MFFVFFVIHFIEVLQGEGDLWGHVSVPVIQNAYKSYRVSFLGESRNTQSPKFRCRVGVGQ